MKQIQRTSKSNVYGIMKAVNQALVNLNNDSVHPDTLAELTADRFVLMNNYKFNNASISILDTITESQYNICGIEVYQIGTEEFVAVPSMFTEDGDVEFTSTKGNDYSVSFLQSIGLWA